MKLEDLKKPFDPKLISWRVGALNRDKSKGIALAYIDARDVMERLDEVCGLGNWQCSYPHANGKTSCRIGIKIGDEWVWKENGAGDSQVEAEKGAFSDAFKRAAVLWGIGRYLYDVQNIWVELDEYKRIVNPKDSRLVGALEKAAAGIRVIGDEPKEAPKLPVNAAELALLIEGIKSATTLAEFDSAKANAKAAWPRLTKAQQDTVTEQVNKTTLKLAQAPEAK